MIFRLLPDGVRAEEMLGETTVERLGGSDPGFMAGRVALHRLGFSAQDAPGFEADVRPAYPEPLPWPPGMVGSITMPAMMMPANYAAAAVARTADFRAIGIGVSENRPFRHERDVLEPSPFVSDEEWAWIRQAGDENLVRDGVHLDRLFRAVKDAVAEALEPLTPELLRNERLIQTVIDWNAGSFRAHLPQNAATTFFGAPVQTIDGRWIARDGIVLAVATVPNEPEEATPPREAAFESPASADTKATHRHPTPWGNTSTGRQTAFEPAAGEGETSNRRPDSPPVDPSPHAQGPMTFPSIQSTASFGEYSRVFREANGLSRPAAAQLFGIPEPTIKRHENGIGTNLNDLLMLRAYDRVLHQAVTWNELAERWGSDYRMNRNGETVPEPDDHTTLAAYVKALRLFHRRTQEEFSTLTGISYGTILRSETPGHTPSFDFFVQLGEALELPPATLHRALEKFRSPELADRYSAMAEKTRPSVESPMFPEYRIAGDFSEYLKEFRRANGYTKSEAARALGTTLQTITNHETGTSDTATSLFLLKIYDRSLHRAGPWNDLATAWGYTYRMAAGDESLPVCTDYDSMHDFIKAIRLYHRMSQEEFGSPIDRTKAEIAHYETGVRQPGTEILLKIRQEYQVPTDSLAAAVNKYYGSEHADHFREEAKAHVAFPKIGATRSLGEYLPAFRLLNGYDISTTAAVLGVTRSTVRRLAEDLTSVEELRMLEIYDRILHRAGPWNDLAERWGFGYRMSPDGETVPDPRDHDSIQDFIRAIRLYYRLTKADFSRRTGKPIAASIETEQRSKPRVVTLRQIRDALDLPNDILVAALRRFYSPTESKGGDPGQDQKFWDLIATRPGSSEEKTLRRQIVEDYLYIAEVEARRWEIRGYERSDLIQIGHEAIIMATRNFVPPGNFTSAAWSAARNAMRRSYFEVRYPDARTRKLLTKVGSYIHQRTNETATPPDAEEISEALGITRDEATEARRIFGLREDSPPPPNSTTSERHREIPSPVVESLGIELPAEVREKMRNALSDLPEPDLAEAVVLLLHVGGMSSDTVARILTIPSDLVDQIGAEALERFRAAFPRPRSEGEDPEPQPSPDSSTASSTMRADRSSSSPWNRTTSGNPDRARPYNGGASTRVVGRDGLDPSIFYHHPPGSDSNVPGSPGDHGDPATTQPESESTPQPKPKALWLFADNDLFARIRDALDTAAPSWLGERRDAVAATMATVAADALNWTNGPNISAIVQPLPHDGVRFVVENDGDSKLPPDVARALDRMAGAWRAEMPQGRRRIVAEFARIDDVVGRAREAADWEARFAPYFFRVDEDVHYRQLDIVPSREAVSEAGQIVREFMHEHGYGTEREISELAALAESIVQLTVDSWGRNRTFAVQISRSGVLSLSITNNHAGYQDSTDYEIIYRPSTHASTELSIARPAPVEPPAAEHFLPADVQNPFDGPDGTVRAAHHFPAGIDTEQAYGRTLELIDRVFADVPAAAIRADARPAAAMLTLELVHHLVTATGDEAMLTGQITVGQHGLEFHVTVGDRADAPRGDSAWRVQDLLAPDRAIRVGTEPRDGGKITWAILDLRHEARGSDFDSGAEVPADMRRFGAGETAGHQQSARRPASERSGSSATANGSTPWARGSREVPAPAHAQQRTDTVTEAITDSDDEEIYVVSDPDEEFVVAPAEQLATITEVSELLDEAAMRALRESPLLSELLPAGEYHFLGAPDDSGVHMSAELAEALRDFAMEHFPRRAGGSHDVHVGLGFAIRTMARPDNALDLVVWKDEAAVIAAAAGRMAGLPHILFNGDGFRIDRYAGVPLSDFHDIGIREKVNAVLRNFHSLPLEIFPPVPPEYPRSGDMTGFIRMHAQHYEEVFQEAQRSSPEFRAASIALGFGQRLTEGLEDGLGTLLPEPWVPLHMDVKPSNVLIDRNGNVTVVDFQLAGPGPQRLDGIIATHRNGTAAGAVPEEVTGVEYPFWALLDIWRSSVDLLRMVRLQIAGELDDSQAWMFASNLQLAMIRAFDVTGRTYPMMTRRELITLVRTTVDRVRAERAEATSHASDAPEQRTPQSADSSRAQPIDENELRIPFAPTEVAPEVADTTVPIGTSRVPNPDVPLDGGGRTPWDRGPARRRGQRAVERLAEFDHDGGGASRGHDPTARPDAAKAEPGAPPSTPDHGRRGTGSEQVARQPEDAQRPSISGSGHDSTDIEAALVRYPGFGYIADRPANDPGEPTGAEFFNTAHQMAWELDWLAGNGARLGALGAFALAALEAEKLLGMPNTGPGPLLIVQDRPRAPGEILPTWKMTTLQPGSPDRPSVIGEVARALSLDEIPQYAYISLVGARPLLTRDIALTMTVLSAAEKERFAPIPRDGVYTLQYPGCRMYANGTEDYLRTRYYADVLLPEIASRTFYGYLMDDVVAPFQVRAAAELVEGYAHRELSAAEQVGRWFAATASNMLAAPSESAPQILRQALDAGIHDIPRNSVENRTLRRFAATVSELLAGHSDLGSYLHHRALPEYQQYIDHVKETVRHRHPNGTAHVPFIESITSAPTEPVEPPRPVVELDAIVENPVFASALEPHTDPAFDRMKAEHFPPVFEYAIQQQWNAIETIAANRGPWTAENALRPFAESGRALGAVKQLFSEKAAVDRDEATAQFEPMIADMQQAHQNRVLTDPALAAIFKHVYEHRGELGLTERERGYVEWKYQDFVRAGAYLTSDQDRRELAEINSALPKLRTEYKDNQQKAIEAFEFRVDTVEQLDGLNDDQIAAARDRAGESAGYLLPKPPAASGVWYPYLSYLNDPELSRRLYEAVSSLAIGGAYDNSANVIAQAEMAARRAQLTGYAHHADYVTAGGIFESVEEIQAILGQIASAASDAARIELPRLAQAIGAAEIHPWTRFRAIDVALGTMIGLDEQQMREYFVLDRVLVDGVFHLANLLLDLSFTELSGDSKPPVWHEDVRVFAVTDANGKHITKVYFDPYAREGKNSGEWTDPIRLNFTGQNPLIGVHLNLVKPPPGTPTLLTPHEVKALFHEFGHELHFSLGEGTFEAANRHIVFGWLEFVAKMFEQFWQHPEVLARFAVHHENPDRRMPPEMLARFEEWRTAYRGTATIFRLSGAYIDLAWSTLTPDQVPHGSDAVALVKDFDMAALVRAGIYFPEIGHLYPSQWFRHLYGDMGGFGVYSGQYSSYLISDVFAPIAFRRQIEPVIAAHGLGREVGNVFRELVFGPEENNLAHAVRRLIGTTFSVDMFLADQRLLWTRALAKLGPGATPDWLTTPTARPPDTDLAGWWNTQLNADEQAAMIQAFPDEVLAMDISHSQDTVEAATSRQQTLREYARQAQRTSPLPGARAGDEPQTRADSTELARPGRRDLDAEDIAILTLLADGHSLAEIRAQHYMSRSTLRSRLDAIAAKLGTDSTMGSVVRAWQQELLHVGERDVVSPSAGYFTSDEVETLTLLARGMSNAQVAEHLRVSRSTVQDRLARVFDKLGVHGRIPAVLAALDRRVISIESADAQPGSVARPHSGAPADTRSTPDVVPPPVMTARPEMPGEPTPLPPGRGAQLPIIGVDLSTGHDIEIDPNDVRTVTLRNEHGHDDVVFLPSSHDRDDAFAHWASRPYRDFEHIYTAYQLPGGPPFRYAIASPEPAVWQRELRATGKAPFIVITHATADFYSLQVRVGDAWQDVFVGGEEYARVLTNNAQFINLLAQDEYRPLIIGSCSPAQNGSSTAQFTAEYLINEAEMDRNIHLAKSVMMFSTTGDTARLAVEAMITRNGAHLPLFDSWWGSPWAFEYRPDR
ncbi:M3 family metallopeptidase [Nocardia cyriacigeorgica]|nr:M3 family metallopeptidase [Nocardia cyriacigeorgica]